MTKYPIRLPYGSSFMVGHTTEWLAATRLQMEKGGLDITRFDHIIQECKNSQSFVGWEWIEMTPISGHDNMFWLHAIMTDLDEALMLKLAV